MGPSTVCGVVSNTGSYSQHLHVDVSGVEGADESDAPPVAPVCFSALEWAAPYLRKGWPVPREFLRQTFGFMWMRKFYAEWGNAEFDPIGPEEQAAIDRLGLTHIVSGMRDGTLGRFNPKGLPGQVMGKSKGTKCTICGMVVPNYASHLHVDVSGVEGADEASALAAVGSPPEAEVCCCVSCVFTTSWYDDAMVLCAGQSTLSAA